MIARRILTVVTLVAVSIHMLLGCCWHHYHPCGSEEASAAFDADCHCHSHSAEDEATKQKKDNSHPCDGLACTFCLPDTSDFDAAGELTDFFPAAMCCVKVHSRSTIKVNRLSALLASGVLRLPEPRHALRQIWLL